MSAALKLEPQQQRRAPRKAFTGPVGVLVAGQYEMEHATQVGEGGMMLTTSRALAPGDRIVVNFSLGGDSVTVIVRAVVRSFQPSQTTTGGREPARVGVEFLNLGFHHKRAIRNFVARATESRL